MHLFGYWQLQSPLTVFLMGCVQIGSLTYLLTYLLACLIIYLLSAMVMWAKNLVFGDI